jgi:hypothetical protein
VASASVEQDNEISFIAIGHYSSGSYLNISRTSKWGISNSNMSASLSSNLRQINITGEEVPGEELSTTSTLSAACGEINQAIPVNIDITQGIIVLDQTVDCTSNCQSTSATITIKQLSVTSLKVIANVDNELTSAKTLDLSSRPDEIVLEVSAIYSNSSEAVVITDNEKLSYTIDDLDGNVVIEAKANTPGTFTVLSAGVAQIIINYRNKYFTARINIPDAAQ